MKAQIENTSSIVDLHIAGTPVRARIWRGVTEKGIEFEMAVVRVAVPAKGDCSEFEKELLETPPPTYATKAFDPRMVF